MGRCYCWVSRWGAIAGCHCWVPWLCCIQPRQCRCIRRRGRSSSILAPGRQVEIWEHDRQPHAAQQAHRAALDAFHAADNAPNPAHGEPHAKKQRFNAPPCAHGVHKWELACCDYIGRMAEPSEGLILLSWISDQNAQYKGIVARSRAD